jgi:6-phosphogluconate dehydrogenase (decarboxylating)
MEGGENIYRFSMVHDRVSYASMYTENEYKSLIIEAQYSCHYHYYCMTLRNGSSIGACIAT